MYRQFAGSACPAINMQFDAYFISCIFVSRWKSGKKPLFRQFGGAVNEIDRTNTSDTRQQNLDKTYHADVNKPLKLTFTPLNTPAC